MTEQNAERRGHCLCGETRLAFSAPVRWVAHCHCESCRRQTASPFTTFIGLPRDAVRFTRAEPGTYRSSPGVERLFCRTCGCPAAFLSEKFPDEIHIYAATLEDPDSVAPECHVHWGEHLGWIRCDDGLPKHPRGGSD